jgi:hypothetical protein
VFELTDHQLTIIGTWAEVAILLFMVWEAYGPKLRSGIVTVAVPVHRAGLIGGFWENRTLILAIVGLVIVAWLHFRENRPPLPTDGFNQAQVDEKIADATKQLKAQLDQATKDTETLRQSNAQQIADAVAKATAPLRGQITQLQSEAPVSVDKLPTSLRLLFKGTDVEEIDAKNIVWTKIPGWR